MDRAADDGQQARRGGLHRLDGFTRLDPHAALDGQVQGEARAREGAQVVRRDEGEQGWFGVRKGVAG